MTAKKMAGIALMVGFGGAFLAWSLQGPAAISSAVVRMAVSGLLALGIFGAWRFLVWTPPAKKQP